MDGLRRKIKPIEFSKPVKLFFGLAMITTLAIIATFILNAYFCKREWLNVHLIAHTHDDVGWLETPEDYYELYVKLILDNVIFELQKNKSRRFVYSESYYLWKWWKEQPEDVRAATQELVELGQLEIVGGGWCMSDEAVTHYQSFIDQTTWGFRRLNEMFGPPARPKVGWQIDTFGHSKGIASLLAQMGLNALFFARIDLDERKFRKARKLMEFVWMGNENIGQSGSIFTSVFNDHYSSPYGFDFEMQPANTPIDFGSFSEQIRFQERYFKTNNLLVPMGDDFRYFNAEKYFEKIDKVIRFFDENPHFKLRVFYSTPSIYVSRLLDSNLKWPVKRGDFFPYASEHQAYWTGYYTSRPTLKYFERVSNNLLQITKQLLVFSNKGMEFFSNLTVLREAVGVLQHHDAVTGTAKQFVTDHYAELLYEGIKNCEHPISESLGKLSVVSENFPKPAYQSCLFLNISECEITEKSPRFVVTVYNPLSRKVDYYVRIPVNGNRYVIRSGKNLKIKFQMVAIPQSVRFIPGRKSTAKVEIVFKASNVPAMGFKSFYISEANQAVRKIRENKRKTKVKVIFDPKTNLLSEIKKGNDNISLSQTIRYYQSSHFWSGAYLFRPAHEMTFDFGENVLARLLNNGDIVKEYEQVFSSWASQIIRLYRDEDFVEFEWLVGPIPVNDYVGKEVVLQYSSNIQSGTEFFTDVNGMGMQKRVKDYRRWRRKRIANIGGNYYPVTTMITIKDETNQIYVINDRPQGGSSLDSGKIELMVHRRLCFDDGKGVDEALNETAFGEGLVARGRHWLFFGKRQLEMEQKAKLHAQMTHSTPWLFFFDATFLTFEDWHSNFLTEFSGLQNYVPRNVRILSLEPWREDTILLRLEHIFEKYPSARLANAPVSLNLEDLFKNFEVLEVRETTLGADRWLSETRRTKWKTDIGNDKPNKEYHDKELPDTGNISLNPQEIRTFIVKIKAKD